MSFSAVVAFLMVAVMPIAFSRSAPENADSLIFVRQSQLATMDVEIVNLATEGHEFLLHLVTWRG